MTNTTPDPRPGPGARVTITVHGTVQAATSTGITLTGGVHVEYGSHDEVNIDIHAPGYQPGDVVAATGGLRLFRVRTKDGVECWMSPEGRRIHDDEISPLRLAPVSRA